ncbi:MAG: heme NO-binding domain-containing protein [Bradymonadaceae bacterium]
MHGTIFGELKKFANSEFGRGTWRSLLEEAGLERQRYSPTKAYPDNHIFQIVEAATKATGQSVDELLEAFGKHLGPKLLHQYEDLLDPEWSLLDTLERTEEVFHTAISEDSTEVDVPDLSDTDRLSENELVIHYRSERQMCGLAKGIARSMADHFGTDVAISEPKCMHDGHSECELHFEAD